MTITYQQSSAFARLTQGDGSVFTTREAEEIVCGIRAQALEALINEEGGLTPKYIAKTTARYLSLRNRADFWKMYLNNLAAQKMEGLEPDHNTLLSDTLYKMDRQAYGKARPSKRDAHCIALMVLDLAGFMLGDKDHAYDLIWRMFGKKQPKPLK